MNTYGTDRDGTETANGSDPLNAQSVPQLSANGDISLDGNVNAADILIAQRIVVAMKALERFTGKALYVCCSGDQCKVEP